MLYSAYQPRATCAFGPERCVLRYKQSGALLPPTVRTQRNGRRTQNGGPQSAHVGRRHNCYAALSGANGSAAMSGKHLSARLVASAQDTHAASAPATRRAGKDPADTGKRLTLEPRLTVDDITNRYSVSAWTVRDWLKSRKLRGTLMDGRWSTTWDAVFAFEGRLAPPTGAARERAKEPLLTVDDIASYFRRKPDTIRRRFAAGKLTGRKIEGCWYADRDAVQTYELASLTESGDAGDAS